MRGIPIPSMGGPQSSHIADEPAQLRCCHPAFGRLAWVVSRRWPHLVIGLSRTDGVPSRPVVGSVTVGGRNYPDHRSTVRVTTDVGLTVGQGIECCRSEFRS